MTTDEMRDAIEDLYEPAIVQNGGTYGLEVPVGVTPQSWYVALHEDARKVSAGDFDEKYAEPTAAKLMEDGLGLGLTSFARLKLEDRPAVQHRGSGRLHRRDRQFIVHALGWK